MPYKPVGIDENGLFPPRVRTALAEAFVTKPSNISDGQVPVWDADLNTWVAGSGSDLTPDPVGYWFLPPTIDGGVWDPETNTWKLSSITEPAPTNPDPTGDDMDGGSPASTNPGSSTPDPSDSYVDGGTPVTNR